MSLTGELAAWISTVCGTHPVAASPLYTFRPGAPELVRLDDGSEVVVRHAPGAEGRHDGYAREAAAMVLAERHGVPAPRVVAVDVDGREAGQPALLITALPGASRIPLTSTTERLEALGAAVARTAQIQVEPTDDLRLIKGPIDIDWAAAGRRLAVRWEGASEVERDVMVDELCAMTGWEPEAARAAIPRPNGGRSARLEEVEAFLGRLPMPVAETVLVHGDLWQGNTMWQGDVLTGLVDWDAAGAGHPGIDLGCARYDAVLLFGAHAADAVLAGWTRQTGAEPDPESTAYWDIRAVLNAPADLVGIVSAHNSYGRDDLDVQTAAVRRDAFLESALALLR
jgi:aminoglycoside phosphotransferase (APT) family kinase protein